MAGWCVGAKRKPKPSSSIERAIRAAGDLVRRLALDAQRDQEAGDLGGRGVAAHDRAHHVARLLTREVVAVEQPGERLLDHDEASRKFFASAGPTGVSTDSGWNWTP